MVKVKVIVMAKEEAKSRVTKKYIYPQAGRQQKVSMGQKVVSNEASQNMMGEIGTYHEDSVSDVYNIPDTNINIGYWKLDSFSDN